MARLIRVLAILRAIETEPRQWTRADLAELHGVSERMIDNDLRAMHALRKPRVG
jgi:predicted DNA-binding transcriptional regulator YafY